MDKDVLKAVVILRAGGVVIFPTDTVWGVGAWVGSKAGIAKLYTIKKRDRQKPTALLVGNIDQALYYGQFSAEAILLVERYWPGALTVVVEAKKTTPKEIQNERGGVGIRWPKSALISSLCTKLPGGIVTSSANVTGGVAPVALSSVASDLIARSEFVIQEKWPLSGTSSTVVDLMADKPKIIRQGEIFLGGEHI